VRGLLQLWLRWNVNWKTSPHSMRAMQAPLQAAGITEYGWFLRALKDKTG
jgi:hypothetical protein